MRTEKIEGCFVNLRIAEEADADFTLKARQNKEKNKYIPSIEVSIEQQKAWIRKQIDSEDCYFFVVERKNGEKIGTFSLYDIKEGSGESGRLVMLGTQIESLETGVLFNKFSFEIANVKKIISDIDAGNNAAIGYASQLGGIQIGEYIDEKTKRKMLKYYTDEVCFNAASPRLEKIIEHFAGRSRH